MTDLVLAYKGSEIRTHYAKCVHVGNHASVSLSVFVYVRVIERMRETEIQKERKKARVHIQRFQCV